MSTKSAFLLKGKVRDDYLHLILKFPLTSLKSEKQFNEAQNIIDKLLAKGKLSSGEEMYLDALSDLVAAYEDVHYPIEPASDAAMLRHLMEAQRHHPSRSSSRYSNCQINHLRGFDRQKVFQSAND